VDPPVDLPKPPASSLGPILVVDDDAGVRESVVDMLTLAGYDVVAAANGLLAIEVIEQRAPALILLDLHMPVLNGWEFARALRESACTVPIIVMTAAADAARGAAEIDAVGYLGKPFDMTELLRAVARGAAPR
jgi:two-component system chemotaxis response regulator CheY